MQFSAPNAAYDELREQPSHRRPLPASREQRAEGTSPTTSPTDPSRISAADDGPLRLVLGDGTADQIRMVLDRRQQDYATQPGFQSSAG
ncbi:hypothetical protein QJS66_23600 (plasmid) [Kocuria rhizophila]|nr:hypothetical protein QJS66_23600 [Kocuria rhizophila]